MISAEICKDIVEKALDEKLDIDSYLKQKAQNQVYNNLDDFHQFLWKINQVVNYGILHMSIPSGEYLNDPLENTSWVSCDIYKEIICPEPNEEIKGKEKKILLSQRQRIIDKAIREAKSCTFKNDSMTYYLHRAYKHVTNQEFLDLAKKDPDKLYPTFCSLAEGDDIEPVKHMLAYYCRGGHGARIGIHVPQIDSSCSFIGLSNNFYIGKVRYIPIATEVAA